MPSPLLTAIYACIGFALLCQVLSMTTRDCSWVDRLWSITPAVYVGWFAFSADRFDPRLWLAAAIVALWGGRLTYNFARKGGYRKGGEDYRWAVVRESMSPAAFSVFNVVFVNFFQHGLLLLLTLPAWVAARQPATSLGPLDALAFGLFALFLVGEAVADQQQWNFHREKAARAGEGFGFLNRGLWRYSRHPNFFCEMGMWWSIYLVGVAAGAPWLNWTLVGPVLLTALFQGSTRLTESISASKYPDYVEYQRVTSRLIPWRVRTDRPR